MSRVISCFVLAVSFIALVTADAKEKKPKVDTSVVNGKITTVNVDEETKKVGSLFIEVRQGNRVFNRNVRIDDKTKFEYTGIAKKEDEKPKVGYSANVKLAPESDVAMTIKISSAAKAAPKVVPKKNDKKNNKK